MQKFHTQSDMPPVGSKLKALRLRAVPNLTIRKMAEELEIGYSRYAYFEDEKRYKKATLPLDLARAIADVLMRHGVDPADVMKLAGLNESEAEPEAREIEAQRPALQFVTMAVALPSEDALTGIFRTMLATIPEGSTLDESARILAQLLPSGFASIGPGALGPGTAARTGGATAPQSPATESPESAPPPRS